MSDANKSYPMFSYTASVVNMVNINMINIQSSCLYDQQWSMYMAIHIDEIHMIHVKISTYLVYRIVEGYFLNDQNCVKILWIFMILEDIYSMIMMMKMMNFVRKIYSGIYHVPVVYILEPLACLGDTFLNLFMVIDSYVKMLEDIFHVFSIIGC